MSDLISRQAAIDELEKIMADSPIDGYEDECRLINALKALPSAQPERKKGEWIRHPEQKNIFGGKTIECSECGEKYVVQYTEDEKFCRNCGADMREEGEQE